MDTVGRVAVTDDWKFAEDVPTEGWDPLHEEEGHGAGKDSPSDHGSTPTCEEGVGDDYRVLPVEGLFEEETGALGGPATDAADGGEAAHREGGPSGVGQQDKMVYLR